MTADSLVALGALVALFCLFYGPWQAVCTDVARQFIFEERDRLFDLARAGKLSFESKEYRDARKGLEGMIRFAHELTWLSLLSFVVRRTRTTNGRMTQSLNQIADTKVREEVRDIVIRATIYLVIMMAGKSVILLPVALILLCVHGTLEFAKNNRVFNQIARQIGSAAQSS